MFGAGVVEDEEGREVEYVRCDGRLKCDCGREYSAHSLDSSIRGYDGHPFLHLLCDGTRVKL